MVDINLIYLFIFYFTLCVFRGREWTLCNLQEYDCFTVPWIVHKTYRLYICLLTTCRDDDIGWNGTTIHICDYRLCPDHGTGQ